MNSGMSDNKNLINLGSRAYTLPGSSAPKNGLRGKSGQIKPTKDNLLERLNAIDAKQEFNPALLKIFNQMDDSLI